MQRNEFQEIYFIKYMFLVILLCMVHVGKFTGWLIIKAVYLVTLYGYLDSMPTAGV